MSAEDSLKELGKDSEKMETLAKRLRRLRLDKGLSLKAVANFVSVPISTYKEWEYGRAIQGEPYEKLAHCLDVSLSELLSGHSPEGTLLSLTQELRQIRERIDFIERNLLSLI